ncbi:MAG: hypothetical protein ACE5FG_03530 [Myxococcota bacterium]
MGAPRYIGRLGGCGALGWLAFCLALGVPSSGHAQLGPQEQDCIARLNSDARKVAQAQGKLNVRCVSDAARGRETDPQGCLLADPKGKVARALARTEGDDQLHCVPPPSVLYTGAAAVNQAAIDGQLGLVEDLFGSDLTTALTRGTTSASPPFEPVLARCRSKALKSVVKLTGQGLLDFWHCKRKALKSFGGVPEVESCVQQLPTSPRVVKAAGKLESELMKRCSTLIPGTAFPGVCSATLDPLSLFLCMQSRAFCRLCETLNGTDGLQVDCDLLDDGFQNLSCGSSSSVPIGSHKCVLATGSEIQLAVAALPLPPISLSGSLDLDCGATDPGTGKTPCACTLQSLDPFEIPAIGTLCATPGVAPCASGEIDCDGGNALDWEVASQHGGIGFCADQGSCEALCATHCGLARPAQAACEGFCPEGPRRDFPCTVDSDCPGSHCPGPEGAPHGGECQCSCVSGGLGGPAAPGALVCDLPLSLDVEALPPPDPCGNGDVLLSLGDRCLPLTTQVSSGFILDANLAPGATLGPAVLTGVPGDCGALASSVTSGLTLVGHTSLLDTVFGDALAGFVLRCE